MKNVYNNHLLGTGLNNNFQSIKKDSTFLVAFCTLNVLNENGVNVFLAKEFISLDQPCKLQPQK
jgi:hypothetical protein